MQQLYGHKKLFEQCHPKQLWVDYLITLADKIVYCGMQVPTKLCKMKNKPLSPPNLKAFLYEFGKLGLHLYIV